MNLQPITEYEIRLIRIQSGCTMRTSPTVSFTTIGKYRGWMDGWIGGWVNGWMDGWMDGWIGGWMDE